MLALTYDTDQGNIPSFCEIRCLVEPVNRFKRKCASNDTIEAELAKSELFRYNNRNHCHLKSDNDEGQSGTKRN